MSRLLVGIAVLSGTLVVSSTPASAKRRAPYARGEIVLVTGVVTDLAAEPVAGIEVVLEASRHSYDYLRFRKRTPVVRTISGTTASDGSFELRWPWDKGFNRFELRFGVTVARPGGDYFHAMHKEDLSRRIKHGSPVVSTVRLEDISFLVSYREFRESIEGEDQREVYREVGKPDKVRRRVSPAHSEVDWWYFDLGKVYRFRDGELVDVEDFEPVTPFDS
ncbi:MAG: hypothetical protein ACE5GX_11335 [Thermoanaerobaculia bacterium]